MHIIGGKSVNNGLNKTPIDVDRVHYAIRLVETHNSAENRQKTKKSVNAENNLCAGAFRAKQEHLHGGEI